MTSKSLRVVSCLVAMLVVALCAAPASAFCSTCGGYSAGYAPTNYSAGYAPAYTTGYAPAYTTAYQPVAYTANYGSGGWFPGCCLGRLFGWQSNYAVAPAPTYAVSYAPACTTCASPCTTCASPCSSCESPCTSCVQQVSMRPVYEGSNCGTSCSSCSGCSSCSNGAVSQAVYQGSSGCSSCGQSAAVAPASTTIVVPGSQTIVVPNNMGSGQPPYTGSPAPELAPGEQVAPRNTFQKMMNEGGEVQPVPAPTNGTEPAGTPPSEGGADPLEDALKSNSNANYFEAPKLIVPNDRTAARVAAPVRNAIYEKPANYRQVSTGRITAAQAQQNAAGWTSASK